MNNLSLWLACGLLTVLAMAFVVVPMLRHRERGALDGIAQRRLKNRAVYEQRLQEFEAEVQAGQVMPEDAERLRTELQRAFLRDMEALEQGEQPVRAFAAQRLVLLGFVVLLPLLALVLYRSWGAAPDLALPGLFAEIAAAEDAESQRALFNELADALQLRLGREPGDLRNAYMLGTLYEELGRHEEALATFEHMLGELEPGPDMATVLGQMARTRYQMNEGELDPEVRDLIDRATGMNPNEYYAMGILANDAFAREDLPAAIGYWRRQLSSAPPGSEQAASLLQVIALVESYLPEQEAGAAEVAGASITVTVDIDPALREQLDDKRSLFVYVRNPDIRPPLLAQNLPIADFPLTLTLDNSMSMTGMTLESAPTLIVGARLSGSGSAIAESGDLETVTEPFELNALDGPLTLVIDTVVP